jgi:flavin reductase (DIM6/NTAB) family NADH-FMN oxidoreductase RutF
VSTKSASSIRAALLRSLPGAVGILGARDQGGTARFAAVSWLTQAAHEPPLLAVSLQADSRTLAAVQHSDAFVLAFLPETELGTAQKLGRSSRDVSDKSVGVMIAAAPLTGAPVPEAACAWLECTLKRSHPVGDHVLVLGEVIGAEQLVETLPPLLNVAQTGWRY